MTNEEIRQNFSTSGILKLPLFNINIFKTSRLKLREVKNKIDNNGENEKHFKAKKQNQPLEDRVKAYSSL